MAVVVFLCESRRHQERAIEEGLEERGLAGSLGSAFLFRDGLGTVEERLFQFGLC